MCALHLLQRTFQTLQYSAFIIRGFAWISQLKCLARGYWYAVTLEKRSHLSICNSLFHSWCCLHFQQKKKAWVSLDTDIFCFTNLMLVPNTVHPVPSERWEASRKHCIINAIEEMHKSTTRLFSISQLLHVSLRSLHILLGRMQSLHKIGSKPKKFTALIFALHNCTRQQ